MSDRFVRFEQIHNFRDFGDYPVAGGQRVRSKRLYRSAHLARASVGDQDQLREIGVHVVADLRRFGERSAEPSAWPEDATPRIIVSDRDREEDLPMHMRFLRDADALSADAVRDYMFGSYQRLPYDERHKDVFREVFRALAAGEGPLLVHCAAGKDRTGVLCALIQHSLGVSREHVLEDYDLSNRRDVSAGILEQTARRLERRIEREIEPSIISPMVGVDERYLQTAFSSIDERSGSVDVYLRDELGVSEAALASMRAHLLEPAASE